MILDALPHLRDRIRAYKDVEGTISFKHAISPTGAVESGQSQSLRFTNYQHFAARRRSRNCRSSPRRRISFIHPYAAIFHAFADVRAAVPTLISTFRFSWAWDLGSRRRVFFERCSASVGRQRIFARQLVAVRPGFFCGAWLQMARKLNGPRRRDRTAARQRSGATTIPCQE